MNPDRKVLVSILIASALGFALGFAPWLFSGSGEDREIVEAVRLDSDGGELSDRRLLRETFILFGMLNWIFGWYSPTLYGSVEDLVGDIYRTFLHGLAGDGADSDEIERMSADVKDWFAANKTNGMW